MRFNGLLFDLDGTLVDSLPDLTTAINLLRGDLALSPLPISQVGTYVGDGATALVKRALPETEYTPARLDTFLDYYQQHLSEQSRAYPGIPQMLDKLVGTPMAVVTNKPVAMAERLLNDLKLAHHFAQVLGGDSCATKKPAPEMLLTTLKELNIKSTGALMIGDHHTDLRAAHHAGIDAAFCTWGYGNDGGETPRFRAESVDELARLLGVA